MAHGDGVRACGERLAPEVGEETRELLLVEVEEFGADLLAREHDVFAEGVLRDELP